jgi:tRNA(Ile)-lysidine synthase TilS/MesJ
VHPALEEWLVRRGYEFEIAPLVIPEDESLPMGCGRCTWNRRQSLFKAAHRLGCNKVALGHHADDLAQTTLMNLIYSGKVETMAPRADYFEGVFHLIRPMCYLPENKIRAFAKISEFPPPPAECPRSEHSRRHKVKALIRQAEAWSKDIRINLLRAGLQGNVNMEAVDEKSS